MVDVSDFYLQDEAERVSRFHLHRGSSSKHTHEYPHLFGA